MQLKSGEGFMMATIEATLLMQLKYCVEAQHLTPCISLGFIDNVKSFDGITDSQLRAYLDSEAGE